MNWLNLSKNNMARYGLAIIVVAAAVGLRYAISPLVGNSAPYLTVCPAIFVTAVAFGIGPGLVAGLIGIALTQTYLVLPLTDVAMTAAVCTRVGVLCLLSLYLGYLCRVVLDSQANLKREKEIARVATEELHRSQQRLQEWMDSIPQIAWRAQRGAIVQWNHRWNRFTGQTLEQSADPGWKAAIHRDDLAAFVERLFDSDERANFYQVQYRVRNGRDGQYRWFLSGVTPVKDDHGHVQYWFGTAIDVEDQKFAERSAAEARSAKERFLAVLSHEFRTPLTPVLTSAEMMLEDPHLPQHLREAVMVIHRNIEIEARLIDDLLDLTRVAQDRLDLHMQVVSIHSKIGHIARVCAAEVQQKQVQLKLVLQAPRHHVQADPERLQQIIWNLLRNAVKFTLAHGRITVSTRMEGEELVMDVSDTGIGIDPSIMPRLFQPFEQGSATISHMFGGLGLGLASCKAMVERHGGTLSAQSPGRGKGATFSVRLPLVAVEAEPQALTPRGRHTQEEAAQIRVLYVEDHPDTAKMTAMVLRRAGYTVRVAQTLEDALTAAREEDFDILVSDLGLPDGSGLDVMRALAPRGVRGIAVTGFGEDVDVRRSKEAGFAEHLTKPMHVDTLLEAICWLTPSSLVPEWSAAKGK